MKSLDTKQQIKDFTEKVVLDVLTLDADKVDNDVFERKIQQAKIGMSFQRDREVSDRIEKGQYIRVVTLISTDRDERKQYMELTMPSIKLLEKKN